MQIFIPVVHLQNEMTDFSLYKPAGNYEIKS